MSGNNVLSRRTTRARTLLDENATTSTRVTRGAAKPVATVTIPVKPSASTATTRRPALAVNKDKDALETRTIDATKRKRDALGELTNKAKSKITGKAKDSKPLSVKTNEPIRRSRSTTGSISESVRAEEIMDIDPSKGVNGANSKTGSEETEPRARSSQRLQLTRTASMSSAPPHPSTAPVQVAPRRVASVAGRPLKASSHVRTASGSTSNIPGPSVVATSTSQKITHRPTPEDDSEGPVHKKRRTSSLDAEEASRAVTQVPEKSITTALVEPEETWVDLDKMDEGDPLMVSEYVVDIFNYMLELEKSQAQQLDPHYIEKQKELNWDMRGILGDWLIQVHARFRLLPETLYLAMHLIDRMLSVRVVSLSRMQLVGVTCLFIASKYEEIMAPSVKHFVECADSQYTEKDILAAEQYVLRVLGWDCSYPNIMAFLRRVSKAEDFDDQTRSIAKFLIEIACVDHRLLPFPPSQIAAASLWLARLVLDRGDWNGNLIHYSTYREKELIEPANVMIDFILAPIQHEGFWKKYASKRYMKVSPYLREWALMRWPEGQSVDLVAELPAIRAAIAERREEVF